MSRGRRQRATGPSHEGLDPSATARPSRKLATGCRLRCRCRTDTPAIQRPPAGSVVRHRTAARLLSKSSQLAVASRIAASDVSRCGGQCDRRRALPRRSHRRRLGGEPDDGRAVVIKAHRNPVYAEHDAAGGFSARRWLCEEDPHRACADEGRALPALPRRGVVVRAGEVTAHSVPGCAGGREARRRPITAHAAHQH